MNVKFVIKYLYLHYTLLNHIKTVHDKIRSFVCTECDKLLFVLNVIKRLLTKWALQKKEKSYKRETL